MIKNITRNIVLSNDAKEARGIVNNVLGMILKKNSNGLIFKTRFGIHTFFMSKPIDVLITDDKKQIAAIKENLKPYRIYLWNPKYENVIELPKGIILKTKTRVGDTLDF